MGKGSDDVGAPGRSLTEDGQRQLAMLAWHIKWLARLAQPRTEDPVSTWTWQARQRALASGLETASQQLNLVLEDISAAPQHADVPEVDAALAQAGQADDSAYAIRPERLVYGVTMDQIDALDRLIQLIKAHGDVVSGHDMADFANGTLTMVGHAIFDGARAVRDLLDQVEDQRLPEDMRTHLCVREEPAVYAVVNTSQPGADLSVPGLWSAAGKPRYDARFTGLRLH